MPTSNSSTPTISSASPSRSGPGSAREYGPCPPTRNGGSWESVLNRPPPGAQCGKPTVQKPPSGLARPPHGRGPHQRGLPSSQADGTPPRPQSRRQRTIQPVPVSTSPTISRDNQGPPQTQESSPSCRHPWERRHLPNRPLLLSPVVRSPRQYVSPALHRHRRHHNRSGPRRPHRGPNRRPVATAHRAFRRRALYRHGAHGTGNRNLKPNPPMTIRPHPPSQRHRRHPRPVSSVIGRRHSGEALSDGPSRPHLTGLHRRCLKATATPTGATAHLMAPTRQAAGQEVRHLHPVAPNVARSPNGQESHHRTGR